MIPLARTNGDNMGGPHVMKAPLRKVKCQTHGHFGRVFFLHAYTTSDLRTFRQTCVHVRRECSLEISVPLPQVVKKDLSEKNLGAAQVSNEKLNIKN